MSPRPHLPKQRSPGREATEARWRLFVAVPLPAEVRALVGALTAELAAEGWPVRWVAAEGAHLTLHFLGETEPERAELLRLALTPVVAQHAGFDLRTAALGVFPNLRRPRVLWLGLHGPVHRLEALHRALGDELRRLGFPVEDGPFHPHVTLGRVRNTGTPEFPLRALPEAIRGRLETAGSDGSGAPPSRPVPVREVELVRSHIERTGPRYESLARYSLAPATRERQ